MTEMHVNPLTETEQFLGYMHFLMKDVRAIRRNIQRAQIDIDEWEYSPSSSSLKMAHKSTRTPIIATDFLLSYPLSTESASLTIGSRTIPLPATGEGTASQIFEGSTTAGPPANTTIATSGTLPAGTYEVTASALYTGTVTFADAMNIALKLGATVIGPIPVQGSAEFVNTSGPYTIVVPAGGATISLATIGVGSGTAASVAQLTITQQTAQGAGAPGIYAFSAALQIEYEDDIILNISPAGPCYLGIMGYSDKRRVDETNDI